MNKSKLIILIILFLVSIINACLILPELEPPVTDDGDSGNDDDNATDGDEPEKEYELIIGFDTFVNSQLSYDEFADEIVVTISKLELIEGSQSIYHYLDKPIVIDFKQLLVQGLMKYIPITLSQRGMFDKVKLHLSSEIGANYVVIDGEKHNILSKQRLTSTARIVNTSDLYFEASFIPKMDVKDCRMNYVELLFDIKKMLNITTDNEYMISHKGVSVQHSCTPLGIGLDYQILMGFDATISSDYENPPSNIFMNVIGIELENDEGSFRYHYAEPQQLDLIDTVLSGYFDLAPLIVKSGLYNKLRVILSPLESENYVVIDEQNYPLKSDKDELVFEINIDQDIDLIECQVTYLMATFDLNTALIPNESDFTISSSGVDATTDCKLVIDGNKTLSAEVVRTIKIYNPLKTGIPSENFPLTSKKYVKIIDGLKYTKTELESTPEMPFSMIMLSNSERMQTYHITDEGDVIVMSDETTVNKNNNEKIKSYLKEELAIVDFYYDMGKLLPEYGKLATQNKEEGTIIIEKIYDGEEEMLKGSSIERTYDKETGLLLSSKTTYSADISGSGKKTDIISVITYTYSKYGKYPYQKEIQTEISYGILIKDFLGEENAQQMVDSNNYNEEEFIEITDEEFNSLMSDSSAEINFVPNPQVTQNIETEIDIKIVIKEEMKNVQICDIEDSFFKFK